MQPSTGTSSVITSDMLDRMEAGILENRPQLAEIKKKYGSMSYFDYVKQKNRINIHKPFQQRKHEISEVIWKETTRLLGSKVADEVKNQLKRNDSVSTAEHTSPIGTAHTLGSALSVFIPMFANKDPKYKNVIILSCSGVSFNNSLSFSRGFQFHIVKDKEIIDNQITFFGRAVDSKTMLYFPPYIPDSIMEAQKDLTNLKNEGKLTEETFKKIEELLNETYMSAHALSANDFPDQMTITNYYFWRKLFPTATPDEIPNYIMLSQEKIVLKLLVDYHFDHDTPIHKLLFNRDYNALIEKYFDGITGAFKKEDKSGTFLFWGLTKDNTRKQLVRRGDKLISEDGEYEIDLSPASIREAILNKELFPSLLLTFILLSFYYGILVGGGASQPTYLTHMKNAYIAMMKEVGDLESANDAQASVTDDYVFFRPHIAFLDVFGERISATGMDMYLYNKSAWREIVEATKSITVNEFITILFPILYKQFCPDDQKEEALMQISRQDVEKFIGFDKKLPPLSIIT